MLDADRPSRDMGKVTKDVLAPMMTLPKANLSIPVEIVAGIPDGASEGVQRIVLENGSALKIEVAGI